jgi:ribosomal protein S17E
MYHIIQEVLLWKDGSKILNEKNQLFFSISFLHNMKIGHQKVQIQSKDLMDSIEALILHA